jgi:hypothetical protein
MHVHATPQGRVIAAPAVRRTRSSPKQMGTSRSVTVVVAVVALALAVTDRFAVPASQSGSTHQSMIDIGRWTYALTALRALWALVTAPPAAACIALYLLIRPHTGARSFISMATLVAVCYGYYLITRAPHPLQGHATDLTPPLQLMFQDPLLKSWGAALYQTEQYLCGLAWSYGGSLMEGLWRSALLQLQQMLASAVVPPSGTVTPSTHQAPAAATW